MTEYEKKQSGEAYDARDPELRAQQNHAKDLMREYNNISAADNDERIRVLKLLIKYLGENSRINQPFYVDYGNNISLGSNSLINLNCTLLDRAK